MMKSVFKFTLLTTCLLLLCILFSCQEDDGPIENSGEISFGITFKSEAGRISEDVELTKIIFTIADNEGNSILEDVEIDISNFDDEYTSDPVSIPQGEYKLTKFLVVGEDDLVYYATPVEGSDLAYLVEDPLPIEIVIHADEVTYVAPEVVSTDEGTEVEFGYNVFGFEFVNTFDLLLAVLSFDGTNQYELVEADLMISHKETLVISKNLHAATNKIVLSDRFDSLTIEITKEGYLAYSQKFSIDSLAMYDGTNSLGALEIVLDPTIELERGLVSYYPFNGNANDESENSNNGLVSGAILTTDRLGNADAAYSFDGIDDYIDLGGSSIFSLGEYEGFTISTWIKSNVSDITAPDNKTIFSKYIAASDNRFYDLYLVEDHDLKFATWLNGASDISDVVQNDISNEWTHVVLVGNDATYTLYINGLKVAQTLKTFNIETRSTTANAIIGAVHHSSTTFDRNFDGKIDELRIYNRTLTTSEINALYELD